MAAAVTPLSLQGAAFFCQLTSASPASSGYRLLKESLSINKGRRLF